MKPQKPETLESLFESRDISESLMVKCNNLPWVVTEQTRKQEYAEQEIQRKMR